MNEKEKVEVFREIVNNKYIVYNSLFLNLPNEGTANTGIYIPLLAKHSNEAYAQSKEPRQVVEEFFEKHTSLKDSKEKYNLLFRMIQYIERQVVLFDCIEDAAFSSFRKPQLQNIVCDSREDFSSWVNHFKSFSTRLVFTAHPTQFYSEDVQVIMRDLRKAIQEDSIYQIDNLLQQLAFTPFIKREKPTPLDEATNIIYYLRYVYYETMGKLYHKIAHLTNQPAHFNPSLIELGFWPGGDRDGNPFVTAEITLKVASLLRNTIMKCYYNHVKALRRKFTFREVCDIMQQLKERLYQQIFSEEVVISDKEILEYLNKVRELVAVKYNELNISELDDIIGRVHMFGSHFATLDIRQDSSKHNEAIEQIFQKEFNLDYHKLSDSEKLHYLTEKTLQLNPENYTDEVVKDTIKNVYQIKHIQQMNGQRGLHRYIISNSESIFDVLHVFALFKYCNYSENEINIDIVPLFETMQGMRNARGVMDSLYSNDVYSRHLKIRNNSQTIMLGFSDGTKDGGYLKANREIYKTKEILTQLSKEHGLQVVFFDGRGGPPARGGGKTHRFYAAQGESIACDKIQLTIQGQTITSIYGTSEQTAYNVEQLLMAGAAHLLKGNKISDENRVVLDNLSEISYNKYLELKNHALFTSYLENMTPLKYYGATNIASRPTKRSQSDKLELKDLRAIPFVGSWSMVRQNVPGYYGLGTALESYADNFEIVEKLYNESAFFRSLIQNSTMSMKKTYFPLTHYMKNDAVYGEFWQELRKEYLLAKKWILRLTGETEFMEKEPMARMSVSMREQIILPLLTIQQYALQNIHNNHPDKEIMERLVLRSLFGNINASRNSA